jgi:hypothetical protein
VGATRLLSGKDPSSEHAEHFLHDSMVFTVMRCTPGILLVWFSVLRKGSGSDPLPPTSCRAQGSKGAGASLRMVPLSRLLPVLLLGGVLAFVPVRPPPVSRDQPRQVLLLAWYAPTLEVSEGVK